VSFRRSRTARPTALKAPRPAVFRPGTGAAGSARRTRPIRRASAGIHPARAAALLVMLLTAAALYGATASSAFDTRSIDVEGATWTTREQVTRALAVDPDSNLFALRTSELAARLTSLPAVASARVEVALPDGLRVLVVERTPILVWRVGERDLLLDRDGRLFAELDEASRASIGRLRVISDDRTGSATLRPGDRIDPVDLDAATRLGSLVPADAGSSARALNVVITDEQGYLVRAWPDGWTAVFGFYTPTLRSPELIPGQVRLLRSLIIGREPTVQRVVLADDRNGTFIPRSTLERSPSASPSGG